MGPALCARCAKQPGSGDARTRCLPLQWQGRAVGCLAALLPQTARRHRLPFATLERIYIGFQAFVEGFVSVLRVETGPKPSFQGTS